MFTSSADVFRTRQAVHDLIEAVRVHRDAMQRLGTTGAERDVIAQIISADCRIDHDTQREIHTSILLAAAMPDDDFACFIGATALLLADLLQHESSLDNLYWNWDAFRDHYSLADPPVRASLMNGYRTANRLGRVNLNEGPNDAECLTLGVDDVNATIKFCGMESLVSAIGNEVSPEEAGTIWQQANHEALNWQMLAGFRYLYERPASMSPPQAEDAALIPWM